jgi:tetratricopeptide (TPR) repeat protein
MRSATTAVPWSCAASTSCGILRCAYHVPPCTLRHVSLASVCGNDFDLSFAHHTASAPNASVLQGREAALTVKTWLALAGCLMRLARGGAVARAAEAQTLFEKAMAARVHALRTQAHPEVAKIAAAAAEAAMESRRFAVAEPLCKQALATAQHGIGLQSAEAAEALARYATCLTRLGKASAAEPILHQCLDLRAKLHGEKAHETAVARLALAENLAAQQDAAGAETLFRGALDSLALDAVAEAQVAKSRTNETALATASAAAGLGDALLAQRKAADAEPYLRDSLAARRRLLGAVSQVKAFHLPRHGSLARHHADVGFMPCYRTGAQGHCSCSGLPGGMSR